MTDDTNAVDNHVCAEQQEALEDKEIRSHSRSSSINEDDLLDDPGDTVDGDFSPSSSGTLPSFSSDDEDADFDSEDLGKPKKVFRKGERQSSRVQAKQQSAQDEAQQPRAARNTRAPVVKKQQIQRKHSTDDSSEDEDSSREESSGSDEEAEEVLERIVSEDEAQEQMLACRNMPEMATIVEFLFRFRHTLKLQTVFTFQSLVDALVRSPGPGMLASLHTELLQVRPAGDGCHVPCLLCAWQHTLKVNPKPGMHEGAQQLVPCVPFVGACRASCPPRT